MAAFVGGLFTHVAARLTTLLTCRSLFVRCQLAGDMDTYMYEVRVEDN
jgi:hypothetical protein